MTADPDLARLCPGCFADKGAANPCPHCGFDEQAPRPAQALALRTLLNGQFVIGRVLGKPGGFGITYLGWDRQLQTRVAIKEYLPRDLAVRAPDGSSILPHTAEEGGLFRYGLEQFLAEARTLARMDHPNIVRVRHFFEANRSAYLVMDYYRGLSLAEHLERSEQRGGPGRLSERNALNLMLPILDGLRAVHAKGFLHRDVKPQNIYLARTDSGGVRPILLDFGAARQAVGERSRSLSVVISPGYAPFEQYHRKGAQGPPTDIYGAAAVLYRMLTGETPPEATERMADDTLRPAAAFGVSKAVSDAIGQGMAMTPAARPQTVQAFQTKLLGAGAAAEPGPVPAPVAPTASPDPALALPPARPAPPALPAAKNRSVSPSRPASAKRRWLGAALTALILLGLGGWYRYYEDQIQVRAKVEAEARARAKAEARATAEANALNPPMIRIRAGSFLMGCQKDEKDCGSAEKPTHRVQVPAFDLGKYEVSFAEWDACVAYGGCFDIGRDAGGGLADRGTPFALWQDPRWPAVVSWNQAQQYVAWLSRKTGQVWRLPSEAEWEYAARAGTSTTFGLGDCIGANNANFEELNFEGNGAEYRCPGDGFVPGGGMRLPPSSFGASRVGSLAPNPWGLHNMHGNVAEWVEDCYHQDYGGAPNDGSAWIGTCGVAAAAGVDRVLRGGSYVDAPRHGRSASRAWSRPGYRDYHIGFRLARTP